MNEDKKTSQADKPKTKMADPRLQRPEAVVGLVRTTQIVIWIGLGLLVVALAWWGIAHKLTVPPIVIAAIGALGVIFWIAYNLRALREAAGTRAAKLVLNSVGFILFVLGIIICLNLIVIRHPARKDLTEGKIHSLAQQSMLVLKALDKDVEVYAFLPQDMPGQRSPRDLMKLYASLSPHVKITWADYTDVTLAKKYDVTVPGTVVITCGERKEKVTDVNESRLTSAILAVTTENKTTVYFLVGHGEASPEGGDNSIAAVKTDLTNQQYVVNDLDLSKLGAAPAVPSECGVLCIIGAKQAPAPAEMAAIEKYVDNKGKLLLALAPPPAPDFASILGKRGVTVLGGIVMEPDVQSNYMGEMRAPVMAPKAGSPIAEGVDRALLPLCRAMKVQEQAQPPAMPGQPPPPPSGPAQTVIESTKDAWLQPSVQGTDQRPADAMAGPFSLVALVDEAPPPQQPPAPGQPAPPEEEATRIVVIGSDTGIVDRIAQRFTFNENLTLNSIAWLSKNVRLISIPPKTETPHNLLLTSTQKNFIIFVVCVFIPLCVIVAGVSVWWSRRR